eukprot:UN14573
MLRHNPVGGLLYREYTLRRLVYELKNFSEISPARLHAEHMNFRFYSRFFREVPLFSKGKFY